MKLLCVLSLTALLASVGCAMHPGYGSYERPLADQPGWQMQGPPMGYQHFGPPMAMAGEPMPGGPMSGYGPANFEPGPDGNFCPNCKKGMPAMMDEKPMHGPDNKGPDHKKGPEGRMKEHGPGHKGPEGRMDERGNNAPEPPNPEKLKQMEEMREKVFEFIKEFHPEKARELRKLHENNPEEFRNEMKELRKEMEKMENMEKENPERYKEVVHKKDLRKNCFELSKAYREADTPEKKAEIQKQLRPAVAELFDLREKDKERGVKEMEAGLKKAVEIQKERQKNRDAIIDDHIREMLGEPDPMKW
ncbi:MAG: hypothetical protein HZA48_08780 [Planctomycetes bacterium]|nr:hypothetical protein [Planctomycetota bacterium]